MILTLQILFVNFYNNLYNTTIVYANFKDTLFQLTLFSRAIFGAMVLKREERGVRSEDGLGRDWQVKRAGGFPYYEINPLHRHGFQNMVSHKMNI